MLTYLLHVDAPGEEEDGGGITTTAAAGRGKPSHEFISGTDNLPFHRPPDRRGRAGTLTGNVSDDQAGGKKVGNFIVCPIGTRRPFRGGDDDKRYERGERSQRVWGVYCPACGELVRDAPVNRAARKSRDAAGGGGGRCGGGGSPGRAGAIRRARKQ